jgi:hypothetical protein
MNSTDPNFKKKKKKKKKSHLRAQDGPMHLLYLLAIFYSQVRIVSRE